MTSPRARPGRSGAGDRSGRTWNLWVPHSCPWLFDGGIPDGQDSAFPECVFDPGRVGHVVPPLSSTPSSYPVQPAVRSGASVGPEGAGMRWVSSLLGNVAATPEEVRA